MIAPSMSPFVGSVWFNVLTGSPCELHVPLGETQQHGKKREEADEDEDDGDSYDRSSLPLLGNARKRRVRLAPQITDAPPVLPKGNGESQDATPDQCEPEIPWCVRKISSAGPGDLLQVAQILNDRETEADQGHRRTLPRHHRALEAQARA